MATVACDITAESCPMTRSFDALGDAFARICAAGAGARLDGVLAQQFADVFIVNRSGEWAFRAEPSGLVRFHMGRAGNGDLTMQPRAGKRFTDLAEAVADLAGVPVVWVGGWPVIRPPPAVPDG